MSETRKISELEAKKTASERLGWRVKTIEDSLRRVSEELLIFVDESDLAKFRKYLDEITKAVHDTFMKETGAK